MRLLRNDLGRAVGQGAVGVHRPLQTRDQNLAKTEIYQLWLILVWMRYFTGIIFVVFFLSHHNIFELDVPMNNTAGMQKRHNFHYFPENYPRNSLYWLFVVFNPVE